MTEENTEEPDWNTEGSKVQVAGGDTRFNVNDLGLYVYNVPGVEGVHDRDEEEQYNCSPACLQAQGFGGDDTARLEDWGRDGVVCVSSTLVDIATHRLDDG